MIPFVTVYTSISPTGLESGVESSAFTTASNTVIWHSDCSNSSSFPDLADSWYGGAMGSIASSGSYLYATDYGSVSGSHGPVYYHTFSPSLTIGQFN